MRIAYFGLDLFAPCLERILDEGVEVAALFTGPGDGLTDFSGRITALARENGIPVYTGKPERAQVRSLFSEAQVSFLLSAYYPYRIPVDGIPGFRGYNIHPGYLPEDRGPWPQTHAFSKGYGGVTIHRLEERFDTGAILLRRKLPLSAFDTIDTLNARCQLAAAEMTEKLLRELPALDAAAVPQEGGAYDPLPAAEAYTLTGCRTVEEAREVFRTYGRCGCFAALPEGDRPVVAAWFYPDDHAYPPGTVVIRNEKDLVIAFRDGFGVLVCANIE